MKRVYPQQVGVIIRQVIESQGLADTWDQQRVCTLWPYVVGQAVNRYTTRRYVDHGVMHVYLTSAPLKNELSFHRAELVAALNRAAGREVLTDIQLH